MEQILVIILQSENLNCPEGFLTSLFVSTTLHVSVTQALSMAVEKCVLGGPVQGGRKRGEGRRSESQKSD